MKFSLIRLKETWCLAVAILACAIALIFVPKLPAAATAPPLTLLAWTPEHPEIVTKLNQATAAFSISVSNLADTEAVIDHVTASCSCTVAKLPSQPWHVAPHTSGEIGVTVNLMGKSGTFDKKISVYFADTNVPTKVIEVTIKMPERSMMRTNNLQIAQKDRQAVFKGDCAACHAEPAKTATGKVLYNQMCGICHEAHPLATMVPNLHLINHPMDYDFWHNAIANGKPGTLMPAFAASQGGPLTDQQIDELAKLCLHGMPYHPRPADSPANAQPPAAEPAPLVPKN
jgi:cytochrome c5